MMSLFHLCSVLLNMTIDSSMTIASMLSVVPRLAHRQAQHLVLDDDIARNSSHY
jgi:hypothetical protein